MIWSESILSMNMMDLTHFFTDLHNVNFGSWQMKIPFKRKKENGAILTISRRWKEMGFFQNTDGQSSK